MTGVSLDTSGFVDNGTLVPTVWPDLSPFEQGYVEALFREWALEKIAERCEEMGEEAHGDVEGYLKGRGIGFSALAHETLAAIRKDCGFAEDYSIAPWGRLYNANSSGGACFWTDRQARKLSAFPPQTPILSEDGKVRFQ